MVICFDNGSNKTVKTRGQRLFANNLRMKYDMLGCRIIV